MNEKVVYNPEESTGQIYYFCNKRMLTLEYEYYPKSKVLMIDIPSPFEDIKRPERERILNFIGKEIAQKQSRSSHFKITDTSIEIHRCSIFGALVSWHAISIIAFALLISGIIMLQNNIILGKELAGKAHFRRTGPVSGEIVIIIALILFVDAWFKRKKIKKASANKPY